MTGWQVTLDLVRRVAAAEGASPASATDDPAKWWQSTRGSTPRYDELIETLAPTDAARQSLLRGYFDWLPGSGGPIEPTSAHQDLARLVADGRVQVVLTTNLDRLIERALQSVGVDAQVLSQPDHVRTMIPLQHAPATVIKLHGDYASCGLRNSPVELATYPGKWRDLLARVLEEYGLVIVGWSADYDAALVEEVAHVRARRYPAYWVTYRGYVTERAKQVIANRQAHMIDADGADAFFKDLGDRLVRLERYRERRGELRVNSDLFLTGMDRSLPGWKGVPLLQLEVAAQISPVLAADVEPIEPEDRDIIVATLDDCALTDALKQAEMRWRPEEAGLAFQGTAQAEQLSKWHAEPGAHQSTKRASYRLGGDATAGLGACCTLQLPGPGGYGNDAVVITIDIGISVTHCLTPVEIGLLARDSLLLIGAGLPRAVSAAFPYDSDVRRVELRLKASQGEEGGSLDARLDWSLFGTPTRELGLSCGASATVPGALTVATANEATLAMFKRIALDSGFTDPRTGLRQLGEEFASEREMIRTCE